jgi:hypothetical protein
MIIEARIASSSAKSSSEVAGICERHRYQWPAMDIDDVHGVDLVRNSTAMDYRTVQVPERWLS